MNRNQDSSRRTVNVEETASKAMVAIDGTGFDWIYMEDDEVPTNMALMAFSDSKVYNDKTCSKTYLKSFETLKTQLDDLRIEFNKSGFNLATYKRGLTSIEEQLVFYKKNEVIFYEQIIVLKRGISYKDSEISMLKRLFSPLKLDWSNSGLEEFQQPEVEGYGPKTSNSISENISNKVKESHDAPLVKELVSDDKLVLGLNVILILYEKNDVAAEVIKKLLSVINAVRVIVNAVVAAAMLPILNPNEFDLWKMRIEHYLLMTVNVVPIVSAASSKASVSTLPNVDSLTDAVIYSFFAMRARKFIQKTRRNIGANGTYAIEFDMPKAECYNCHRRGYFSRDCRSPRDNRNEDTLRRTIPVELSTSNALVSQCDGVGSYDWSFQAKEEPTNYAIMTFTSSGSSSSSGSNNESQFNVLSYKTSPELVEARLVVYQQNENVFEEDIKLLKLDVMLRNNALVELRKKFKKAEKERDELNLTLEKFQTSFKNLSKLLKSQISDKITLGYDNQVFDRQVFDCDELNSSESDDSVPTSPVRDRASLKTVEHPQQAKNLRTDNPNSRGQSPTSSKGKRNPKGDKITGKGKIKTSKLDFDDLYFLKELKFNLSNVSQMCDKKNSVLFTNTECVVLSFDFKLPDENHVLLRVPRENNMYNVDLKNNGVVERKNRTLIEAARTMLADSLIIIPFWAEAVNTACYVQNQVLVTKPHNKTPYELLLGRTPSIGFMRHFGCPVTILNTLDPLGKFDGKADEGFLVGYFINRKAFRLFNSRTRIVQKTLHINFLENQPNVTESGPKWLFDINTLTQSMNYQPVVSGNQPNHNAGIKENLDACKVRKETVSAQQYLLLPLWSTGSQDPQNTDVDAAFDVKKNENEVHVSPSSSDKPKKHDEKAKRKSKGKSHVDLSTGVRDLEADFEEFSVNNANRVNAASAPVTAVGPNPTNSTKSFNTTSPSDTAISLNFGIARKYSFVDPFNYHDDPDMPALEDIVYLDDEEDVAEADFSNLETNISVSPILTARVHKDHPEEGIDYDEVFAPVARIKAIRLFLAYASFIGFMVYQMDVKSGFLYGTIKEEVYVYQPPGFEDPDYLDKVYKVVKALYGLDQAHRAWYETLANYLLENGFQRGKIDQTLLIKHQKVKQKDDGIFISQDKYVAGILKKFRFTDVKSASTPIETEKPLLKVPDGEDVDVNIYRHLKGKTHLGLWYLKDSPFNLVAYFDSDYARASLGMKSTTGGCQFLGCRLISCQYKKQIVVATSSTESEYVVAASCCAQVLWIQNQLLDYSYNLVPFSLTKAAAVNLMMLVANLTFADTHNMIAFLSKLDASDGFDQIVDFLNAQVIQYALMVNPTIYVSCIKQFWATTSIKKTNDVVKLQALIDRKKVVITEDVIRQDLYLDDADSVECLPTEEIFAKLARMGYETPPPNAKRTAWNEFSCSMATAVTCLATEEEDKEDEVSVTPTPPSPIHAQAPPQAQPAPPSLPPQEQPTDTSNSSMTLLNTLMETWGKIAEIDADEDITLVDMEPKVDLVFDDEEVTMTMAQTLIKMKAEKVRLMDEEMAKRLHDEEVKQAVEREKQEKGDLEKAKVLQKQYVDKQENIDWNVLVEQMQEKHLDNIRKYQSLERKPIFVAQANKNMIVYLKNMVGYKMEHFKGQLTKEQEFGYTLQVINKLKLKKLNDLIARVDVIQDLRKNAPKGLLLLVEVLVLLGNPQLELQEKGVIDNGCSIHMTENMSYLFEYEEMDGGYVAFGGDLKGGKITSKDIECVVLSPDFKLLNENQVLLRVPRENNMYSIDLKNVAPSEEINYSNDDKDVVVEADMTYLNFNILVSLIPTTIIHKDHPVEQIIRDIHLAPQTRRMTKNVTNYEPKKVIQALTYPSWIEVMHDELLQFKLQQVWTLVDLPYDKREGIDYDEVFAPIARIEAIRLFLAYVSFKDFVLYQMDVKSAFLYRKIEEEVYVCQPPGFKDLEFPDRVYKVEKALYCLHQAPKAWYETLSTYLLDNGFHRGQIDKTLFIKMSKGNILLVQVYFDDIIFGSTKKEMCTEFEKIMHKKFQMSSIREIIFFFGLQVTQKDDGIFISQDKYMDEILKKFGFSTVKTASIPMETSKPLLKDKNAKDVDVHLYRSMIGSLMYLTSSMPDIMFVVCACARFQVTPKVSHLYTVKRIFRYLKGQCKLGLWYPKDSPFDFEAYTDSDYAVPNSITEAEYVAASNCYGQTLEGGVKFLMFPRFVQVFLDKQVEGMFKHKEIYVTPSHSKKVFANMKRHGKDFSGRVTPLFPTMLVQAQQERKQKTEKPRRKDTKLPQTSVPIEVVADEAIYKEMYDSMERATTTATGLDAEHDRDEASLGYQEDASKQRRIIDNLDADEGVTLVDETQGRNDQDMFNTSVLDDEEVVAEKEVSTVDPVTTVGVEVSVAVATLIISMDDITLAKALIALKSAKPMAKEPIIPKAKGIVMQEPEETTIRTATTVPSQSSKDKGKEKIIEPEKPLKKKDQIMIDEEVARNLEAQLQEGLKEEKRLARQKEEEANISLIAKWDDVQAMMDAGHELAERLQAQEQGELNIKESERRAEGSSKRAGEELKSDKSKKQKLDKKVEVEEDNDQEEAEIKMYMKIIFDDEIALDAIPLATKPPIIVDWKIIKEGKISSYHIINNYRSSKRFSSIIQILQNIDREDLETIWNLVKAKYGNTRPKEAYERVL
nr:hypothetical protein [Tanacetum cinerariifolium]